eukprot:8937854-Pyramimonas_sp.AAC.1
MFCSFDPAECQQPSTVALAPKAGLGLLRRARQPRQRPVRDPDRGDHDLSQACAAKTSKQKQHHSTKGKLVGKLRSRCQETVESKYNRMIKTWARKLFIDPNYPEKGVWLQGRTHDSLGWSVGCVACNAAGLSGQWARMEVDSPAALQLVNALRHAGLSRHKEAIQQYLGNTTQKTIGAPSYADFKLVIDDRRNGVSLAKGNPRVGSAKKCTEMTLQLADAICDLDKEFLKTATVNHIKQDARFIRLMTTFTASNSKLQVRSGIIW